jgi:hypothetical protein
MPSRMALSHFRMLVIAPVIASEAKQSRIFPLRQSGLFRSQ